MSDLESLLERVKAASGPDRKLDFAIFKALGVLVPASAEPDDEDIWQLGDEWCSESCPYPDQEYTADIDAALALVEHCLPGWHWSITGPYLKRRDYAAYLCLPHETSVDFPEADGRAATPPLAILAALLTALIAKEREAA
jgi:hypothetical protein